jgi:hypothetical protein
MSRGCAPISGRAPPGRALTSISDADEDTASMLSVADDIERRITAIDHETARCRQQISGLRKRLSAREQAISGILDSLGLARRTRAPPSLAALAQIASTLDARITASRRELSALLASADFARAATLESDIIAPSAEADRLRECLTDASEYAALVGHDLETARARIAACLRMSDVPEVQAANAALAHQLGELRTRALGRVDPTLDGEREIRGRIQLLEGSLQLELLSASKALELQQESARTLMGTAADAATRIRDAITRQRRTA